jgi:hypothetical protein
VAGTGAEAGAKDYERLPETAVAMIYWAMSRIMLRRLVSAIGRNALRRAYEGSFEPFCRTVSSLVAFPSKRDRGAATERRELAASSL